MPLCVSSGCEFEELSEDMFESVPLSVRSNIRLSELTEFYQQLQQHLSKDNRLDNNTHCCPNSMSTVIPLSNKAEMTYCYISNLVYLMSLHYFTYLYTSK